MARQKHKLSAIFVKNISKPGYYGDGNGLWLQVSKAGTKSWVFRFQIDKQRHEMGLGSASVVGLADARAAAVELRKALVAGINPLQQRREQQAAARLARARETTFQQAADTYIKVHRSGWRNPKHAAQWESTIREYVGPVFGNLSIQAIDTALVQRALGQIWNEKHETASRLRGRIERILDWAGAAGLRTGENPARWKGNLEYLLPRIAKSDRVTHHPALPIQQLHKFMQELRSQSGVAALALELLVLTAARTSEVLEATWDEFDLAERVWTIPASRMKAKKEHRVPLSDAALRVLDKAKQLSGTGEFVFPGARPARPLSNMALIVTMRRMGYGEWVPHGFRSTFRDWAGEMTNHAREVAEHALAHRLKDRSEAAYQRGTLFTKRAVLMADWARFCDRQPAEVLPISDPQTDTGTAA